MALRVAILSTGHEVLRGLTLDTNAAWLSLHMTEAGATVVSRRTVGDDARVIAEAILESDRGVDALVVTGGLGPTEDDRTREGLALAAGVELAHDERAWNLVRAAFSRSGRVPSDMQRRQALLPEGAIALENPVGTAPGVLLAVGGVPVFLLPGPPREMRATFETEVLPLWRASGDLEATALRVLWTAGLPEAEVASAIDDLMKAAEPVVGTHPDDGEVAVRLLARGHGAGARADAAVSEIRRWLGAAVVSTEEDVRVQHAVVRALLARRAVVATGESVTGGLVARMLVEVPGASDAFRGGFVTYSDEWKRDSLGVDAALLDAHGAVSAEVAAAMAVGARTRGRCDFGLATTGVAGPEPDARGVVEGTVFVAVASATGVRTAALRFPGPRVVIQRRAAVAALDLLRRTLLDR